MGEIQFLKAHERLILVLVGIIALGFLVNKYINHSAAEADARNQAAQSVLQAQKEANAQTALQVQQAQAQYQALVGQLNAQNAKLTAEMLTLSQALAARQKADAALPLPDLALRQEALLGVSSGITAQPGGLLVSSSASVQTVQALEQLPVLKQSLADETAIADNRAKQVDSSQTLVVDLNKQVAGLNLQLVDSGNACKTQLAAINANARKSKRNWFLKGLAVGGAVVAYVFLHA